MIKIYNYPKDNLENVLKKSKLDFVEIQKSVREIISDVKNKGDEALFEYTKKFDGLELNKNNIKVSNAEIEKAYETITKEQLSALRNAVKNVYDYHMEHCSKSKINNVNGCETGILIRPLENAGIYVPGGTAAYPSSVLMCALPAKAAGVKRIIMCSPKITNPLTIVAANECGVNDIYKVGGAQAIAALCYGSTCIPKTDIIAGPGNIFVTMAKKEVFGDVKIDMIAGPSEILIIADKNAKANIVAADLLSQAEHDVMSKAILITDSIELARAVQEEVDIQSKLLPRNKIIDRSVNDNGAIIIVKDLIEGIKISNMIAPEHLELAVANTERYLGLVENAGAIFAGYDSPEPLGDYYAGPSHVLPTSGTARYFEVLNTDTFTKKMSYIHYSKEGLAAIGKDIIELAEAEGFSAHANAIRKRIGEEI